MKKEILGFFGEYRWLSNFALVTIEYEGLSYISTEHAYQASKTLNLGEKFAVKDCKTCKEARWLGQVITKRADWEDVKLQIMYDVNLYKYSHPEYNKLLLATGDAYLEETNTWNDIYWGVCNGIGQNNLGKILMQIRSEFRS